MVTENESVEELGGILSFKTQGLTWLSLGNMFPIFASCGLVVEVHT